MASPRSVRFPSHVLHVDDIMIFCSGTINNVLNLMQLFNLYKATSGQVISKAKSKVFVSAINHSRCRTIADLLDFNSSITSSPHFLYGSFNFQG